MKSARSATPSTNRFVPFIATTALVIGTVVTATPGATADGGTAPPSSGGRVVAFGEHPDALRTGTFTAVAAGDEHSVALTDDGKITMWGTTRVGITTVPDSLADKTVVAISAGREHTAALSDDGEVTVWGGTTYGQRDLTLPLRNINIATIAATNIGLLAKWWRGEPTESARRLFPHR